MNNSVTILPIGSHVKVHHMPDDYYSTWEKLRKAEKLAFNKAQKFNRKKLWESWKKASQKLRRHESNFSTN